ncbi:MAG: DUF695 domain-containing protein [Bacteroidota bacterium]
MQAREEQAWDFFFCTLAGKPASIRVNLSLLSSIPLATHPQLVYVIIPLEKPDSQGMIQEPEVQTIRTIEADIVRLMTGDLGGKYAFRYTGKGRRALYFYLPLGEVSLGELLATCMEANDMNKFSYGVLADPSWRFFQASLQEDWIREKYPEHLLKPLQETEVFPQEIEHSLGFSSEKNRYQFLRIAQKKNFAISQLKYAATQEEYPFLLQMSRIEFNSPRRLQALASLLQRVATKFQGTYLMSQPVRIGK